MATIIKRRLSRLFPTDATQPLRLLRLLPMRHPLTKALVVLPAAHIRIPGTRFHECAGAVLLIGDPLAVVRVTVLVREEAMPVALPEAEGARVGGTCMVDARAVAVFVAVAELAFVVLG